MEPNLVEEIQEIFTSALELPLEIRGKFLDSKCGVCGPLRERVSALLDAHSKSGDFFAELARVTTHIDRIPEFLPGELVGGRFTILRLLGQGGAGDVYEASDAELSETVAMKILRASPTDESYSDQFREEVRLSRKILNPHVCRVHDVGRHPLGGSTCLFLTMELLSGCTLAKFLSEEHSLGLDARCNLVRQLAEGLEAAHRAGVVHGDLKSSNVIVMGDARGELRAVITDFGLARYVGSQNPFLVGGTPAYMAPEQIAGSDSGIATDIYSFGVLAYETLTGVLPFAGHNREELNLARSLHPTPEVHSLCPGIAPVWNRLVARCLERDPARRYESVTQAIADLPSKNQIKSTRRGWILGSTLAIAGGIIATRARIIFGNSNPDFSNTLVVLPFHGNSELAKSVADSMGEQLASTFSKVPGMRVIAPTTAAYYGPRQASLAEIGKELHVRSVLKGDVREIQDGIRIAAELSDTHNGRLLWSEAYDMRFEDLRRAHETIARAVIRNLSFQLSVDQTESLARRHATSDAAYSFYLLGQHFAEKRDGGSLDESIRYFLQAIDADPKWAVARGALADAYCLIATKGVMSAISAYEYARIRANEALSLDERVPEAHMALAGVAQYQSWSWAVAAHHHQRAVDLDPGSAETRSRFAGYLSMLGEIEDSLSQSRLAVAMDPLSIHIVSFHATDLYRARRIDEAIQRLNWMLRRDPDYVNAHIRLADCYGQQGKYAEAARLAQMAVTKSDRAAYTLGSLGEFTALNGETKIAQSIVGELEALYSRGKSSPCYIAQVWRGLRVLDKCIEWLERGLVEHDSDLPGFKSDPANDVIRQDPRFLKILTAMGM